jgi:hypothetical protein
MTQFSELMRTQEGRHWLASRYVMSELTVTEADVFESAMEHDPELCEILTDTVRLHVGIQSAFAERAATQVVGPISNQAPSGTRFSRLSVSSALITVVGLMLAIRAAGTGYVVPDEATAAAYARLIAEDGPLTRAEIETVDLDLDVIPGLEAPEWLLSAVELESVDQDESQNNSQIY